MIFKFSFIVLAIFAGILISNAYAEAGQQGAPVGVIRDQITSIKFLDAYFGTSDEKIEAAPGDTNMPFTVIMANVGTQDLTGIRGKLTLPAQYTSVDGKFGQITADNEEKATAGNTFALTFYVNINDAAEIKRFAGHVDIDYSRLRETGVRTDSFDFTFKLTGDSVVNLTPSNPFITSLVNNNVDVVISNSGTAPLSNVEIVLQNTETSTSTTTVSKNLENVIFDENHWDVGTIIPGSSKSFSFNIYVPENLKNEPLHAKMEITYFDGHGEKNVVTRNADFYINGLIKPSIYGVKVIELSGQPTVIGDILNEGNTDGLFGFVTLQPRGDSNIKEATQYIDEIEPDSPVPFNIPIKTDGILAFGEHDIRIIVEYKDSLREEQTLTYDTTITISPFTSSSDSESPVGSIITLVIIAGIIYFLYRKGKLPFISKKLKPKVEPKVEPETS